MKRRDFIKIVGLSGSGLVLGSFIPAVFAKGNDGILEPGDDPKGVFKPGPFIQISSSGEVTIFMAKTEMGQGVYTALPMIVAEELEVDWEKINIVQADAGFDYGNQTTGGSTSIRQSYDPLRKAGATARVMLVTAAAAMLKESVSDLYAELGFVISRKTGKKLGYGELAVEAAKLPVPTDVPLKDPKDFKVIGKSLKRKDTPPKLYGEAVYGIDVRLPGMVYAAVKRPPVYSKGISGEWRVASGEVSVPVTRYPLPEGVSGVIDVFEISTGLAVTGKSTWQVFNAAEKLKAEWVRDNGTGGLGFGVEGFNSEDAVKLAYEKIDKPDGIIKEQGNVVPVFEASSDVVMAIYEVPFLAHAPLEPMNCTAEVKDGKCEIWAPTQSPQRLRKDAANLLGIDEKDVTVHVTFLGGGFGRRLSSDFGVEAVEIARKTGAPVKVTWTREDDTKHGIFRPFGVYALRGVLGKKGTIQALQHRIAGQSIRAQWSKEPLKPEQYDIAAGSTEFPYEIKNFRIEGALVQTPLLAAAYRAVYHTQVPFAVESFIDELAHSKKIDPFKFRQNLMKPGSRERAVLELAAEKAGWGKTLPKGQGMGIAFFQGYDSYCAQIALVKAEGGGLKDEPVSVKVLKYVAVIDCGLVINPDTVKAQMEGAIIFALSAAMKGKITVKNGAVEQSNYDDYPIISFDESPDIETHIMENTFKVGGVGEVGIGACPAALANAIYAASGKRPRKLPVLSRG
ncbi:MAG: aldehyde dehydrogenase [Chlorobiota bacterium]